LEVAGLCAAQLSGHTREDNVVARHEQAQQQRGQELQAAAERCVALAYHTLAQLFLSATVVSERSTDRHVSSVRKGDQSNPYGGTLGSDLAGAGDGDMCRQDWETDRAERARRGGIILNKQESTAAGHPSPRASTGERGGQRLDDSMYQWAE